MGAPLVFTPDTAYLTKPNIVHPISNLPGTQGDTAVASSEAAARAEIQNRVQVASGGVSVTVTGGSVKKGK